MRKLTLGLILLLLLGGSAEAFYYTGTWGEIHDQGGFVTRPYDRYDPLWLGGSRATNSLGYWHEFTGSGTLSDILFGMEVREWGRENPITDLTFAFNIYEDETLRFASAPISVGVGSASGSVPVNAALDGTYRLAYQRWDGGAIGSMEYVTLVNPEPASALLFSVGLFGLGVMKRVSRPKD